ncbi:COP9 signalosome (CSN) subunit [Malassezia cuniculi]|uniref:COP9 signalosome (CSN) subunit n=1 Tax=Malassezia cuniculi TaxID=948313 RepID=A0AAF0EXT1_9BASI|nr:COP9 signalosome (CSN) subunit [Malassezia cuniculi]
MRASEFATSAGRAVRASDGAALSELLSLRGSAVQRTVAGAGISRSWHEAHEAQNAATSAFLRIFATMAPGRWALSVLYTLLRDLRWVSIMADRTSVTQSRAASSQKHLEECARQLNKAFGVCAADRHPDMDQSRKWGTYAVANMLFSTYFALKSLALCRNILRALSAGDIPPLEAFGRGDVVTYRYYLGRLRFLDEDYDAAESELARALAESPASAPRNQERILIYLVPMRLLRGIRPSAELLRRFPQTHALYGDIVEAYSRGDARAYDAALRASDRTFVRLGLYLALERARAVCISRLFRR